MSCLYCNNSGYVEIFSCCTQFNDLLNLDCCGTPESCEEICHCGIIKLFIITFIHNDEEFEDEIYINAKTENEAINKFHSKVEDNELPEDSIFMSISEI